ncbi:MAG: metal-dependent transcriptional regulator [Candidatus Aenigmatarchaeota archaeon]
MMKLTKSLEDYMEAAYITRKEKGKIRLVDISDRLEVKLPSANQALKKLRDRELLVYEKYGNIELTEKGENVAKEIYRRHKILFTFLTEILDIDEEVASEEACTMEHALNPKTQKKLASFVKNYGGD